MLIVFLEINILFSSFLFFDFFFSRLVPVKGVGWFFEWFLLGCFLGGGGSFCQRWEVSSCLASTKQSLCCNSS